MVFYIEKRNSLICNDYAGSIMAFVYTIDGVKLKARHITAIPQGTGSSSSSTNYIMSKDSTDYIGDFIYHNNRFSRYNWGNGYVAPLGNSYTYRFYIRDHQGNNRVVTTSTGTVKQTMHYYPDGVTHDKSTEQGEQVYKYNGKELDRMHGLDWYDYGAREYDPTIGQFTSMDPLCEKNYHISPYAYCAGNPVRYVDPDGRKVVFVNGYLGLGSPQGGATYWNGSNSSFVKGAQSAFKDYATPYFTDYDYEYMQGASVVRESLGYQYAKDYYTAITEGMEKGVDKFNFVSHSMGGAFSEGMIRYLAEQGWEIENAVFLNAWEPSQIINKAENNRIDATCTNDPVQFFSKPVFGEPDIPSSDNKIRIQSDESIMYIHRDLIDRKSNNLWNTIINFLRK